MLTSKTRTAFRTRVASVFAALLVWNSILSLPAQAADRAEIVAFLDVTGFGVALESIAHSAEDAPLMLGMQSDDFGILWEEMAEDVFDVIDMREMALGILEKTLSGDALRHAAEFYASDLGQKLVNSENAAYEIEDSSVTQEAGRRIIAELVRKQDPLLGLYKRMNVAIGGTDTSIRALQEIQYRFLVAAASANVIELRLSPEDLREKLRANEGQLRRRMAQASLAGNAYTYQGFSEGEILQYVEALEDPKMQEVYALLNAVQYEIQANRFEELAKRMQNLRPVQDL